MAHHSWPLRTQMTGGGGGAGGGSAQSQEAAVKAALDDFMGRLPQPFNMVEIESRVKERIPYVVVALQVGGKGRGGGQCWQWR